MPVTPHKVWQAIQAAKARTERSLRPLLRERLGRFRRFTHGHFAQPRSMVTETGLFSG